VRWPPACKDLSPGAEERALLEDVTKQSSEDRDGEGYFFVVVICKVKSRVV
jgi:hypothetical protein